ncbi:MAG: hypothetical protein Tsb0017_05890 [Geothermobacteraceae bacterium]
MSEDTKKRPSTPTATGRDIDDQRRDFLRKSVWAAYATPVITALLVGQASAFNSKNPPPCCSDRPNHPKCNPWC